jgi:hypothetical protein
MITNRNSVFPVVLFDETDRWECLLELAKSHLDVNGLKRLQKVLSRKCKCVVIEHHYIDKDYRDTFSNFHSKRFNTPDSRCVRLHFFSLHVTHEEIAAAAAEADASARQKVGNSYLGYSVIRPTKPYCIGRTFLSHVLRVNPSAHLSTCKEEVHLMGTPIQVQGFPFISQDSDATVCAEASLWMLLRYYSNRYRWYSEVLPFQVTSLTADHAYGSRVYPSGGRNSWQLAEGLRLQRFSPMIYNRQEIESKFKGQFDHLLYTYVESGLPLLATVPGHVMVIFGHTSNYSLPLPKKTGDFIYSSHFNRAYVVHDDNCFPYQMLNQEGPKEERDSNYSWKEIDEFIVPLPEKVFLPAEEVKNAIEKVLRDPKAGLAQSKVLNGRPLLLRLFLTSARAFKRRLTERTMGNPLVEQAYRQIPMPHFFWVCEIADYMEYSSSRKVLGEVIWDATRNAHEPDGWIALHLPEKLIIDQGAVLNKKQELQAWNLSEHKSYSLFQSNLHTLN